MEMVQHAGDAGLFATCPGSERELLRSLAVPMRVKAGEDLVRRGDFGSTIGVVIEGRASVWVGDDCVAELQPGDCYGELAVLATPGTTGQRAARVTADTEVRVDTIAKRELVANLGDIPVAAELLRQKAAGYSAD